jgi:hypothetical protein
MSVSDKGRSTKEIHTSLALNEIAALVVLHAIISSGSGHDSPPQDVIRTAFNFGDLFAQSARRRFQADEKEKAEPRGEED